MRKPTVITAFVAAIIVLMGYGVAAAYYRLPPFADSEPSQSATSKEDTKQASDEEPTEKSDEQAPGSADFEPVLYYVATNDNGVAGEKIGCDDSLVQTKGEKVQGDDEVVATMQALLENHDQKIGESGLYNALYQSELTFNSWEKTGKNVTVRLSGEVRSGGTCDDPRIIAQLEHTAATAAGAETATVMVNEVPIEELLSSR